MLENAEETAEVPRKDRLYTGDIRKMDKNCHFYITKWKKDLIRYKGYNIHPRGLGIFIYGSEHRLK